MFKIHSPLFCRHRPTIHQSVRTSLGQSINESQLAKPNTAHKAPSPAGRNRFNHTLSIGV